MLRTRANNSVSNLTINLWRINNMGKITQEATDAFKKSAITVSDDGTFIDNHVDPYSTADNGYWDIKFDSGTIIDSEIFQRVKVMSKQWLDEDGQYQRATKLLLEPYPFSDSRSEETIKAMEDASNSRIGRSGGDQFEVAAYWTNENQDLFVSLINGVFPHETRALLNALLEKFDKPFRVQYKGQRGIWSKDELPRFMLTSDDASMEDISLGDTTRKGLKLAYSYSSYFIESQLKGGA